MQEIRIKTHLIITDVRDEYSVKWFGSIINCDPVLKNGVPIFVLVSSEARIELNTIDITAIEECGKRLTRPKGRSAITSDKTRIFIKEKGDKETYIGVITHNHVKTFAPMYDKVGYR